MFSWARQNANRRRQIKVGRWERRFAFYLVHGHVQREMRKELPSFPLLTGWLQVRVPLAEARLYANDDMVAHRGFVVSQEVPRVEAKDLLC
jgi:hypothetical protein